MNNTSNIIFSIARKILNIIIKIDHDANDDFVFDIVTNDKQTIENHSKFANERKSINSDFFKNAFDQKINNKKIHKKFKNFENEKTSSILFFFLFLSSFDF